MERKLDLDQKWYKGNLITDINYDGLGGFRPLEFGNEDQVLKSIRFLDLAGSMPAPSYGTVLELAYSRIHGHGVQGNPCLVLNFVPHGAMMEEDMVQGVTTLGGALAYPNSLVVAIVVSHKFYTALVEDKDQQ